MRHRAIGACALALAALAALAFGPSFVSPADAKKRQHASTAPAKKLSSARLQRLTTTRGINAHLKRFQRIASAYGDRFAGGPGYDASAQYVYDQLEAAGYQPKFDEFSYEAFRELTPTTFSRNGTAYTEAEFGILEYSGPGDVTGPAVKVEGLGCTAGEIPAGSANQIAVINRGTCSFREKVVAAAAQGYGGVVIVNNAPGPLNGTLGAEGLSTIPGVGVTTEVGNAIASGDTLQITADTSAQQLTTRNVIAETKGGDPDNVVVVGGHLDGVAGGPGVNDNGTGSGAILEVAKGLKKIGVAPKNKVRFAWWSAEESGLIGATDYVSRLTPEEQLDIALYLNFDMVGSSNFARLIYDGDDTLGVGTAPPPGSDAIEANFERFFAAKNLPTDPTEFNGRSDYGPFIGVGIPAGGLFSGADGVKTPEQVAKYGGVAGQPFDPFYHTPQDTFANVNQTALDQLSDGIADAVATYANDTSSVDDQDQAFRPQASRALEYSGDARLR